jgi:ABC-2 type transport system ATP-binding protein
LIQVDQLTKTFRRRRVLDAIDLAFGPGERVALTGANGAGKTTFFRCLLGEYRHGGRIQIDGRCPRTERRAVLRRIGFVPQLPPALRMPVGQLVRFATTLCGCPEREVERVAKLLGLDLDTIRSQPFVKLSGGQKQKVLIALALREQAELLVMDEPAANLDPAARAVFFTLLRKRSAGRTMLISIHRLDDVAGLATRVVELDQGKVVEDRPLGAAADARS